jgi:hypothetical protein
MLMPEIEVSRARCQGEVPRASADRLDILDDVAIMGRGKYGTCSPSWVPDWLNGSNKESEEARRSIHCNREFQASVDTVAKAKITRDKE